MQRDPQFLLDILTSSKIALEHVSGKEFSEFERDVQCQDAVLRRLEIIGEAANRVSIETQKSNDNVPWHALIGMRNFVIHQYDSVDLQIVWDTVHQDLPSLITTLQTIIRN